MTTPVNPHACPLIQSLTRVHAKNTPVHSSSYDSQILELVGDHNGDTGGRSGE